ncbi:hypothetical protein OFO10_03550 [Campylobacter sp. VBCF_06 NA8]|uniref:hypothetical protein n=1 Tax=unclassified Campylobacter TaxID=2593542 RepID=UPI0022E9BCA8|nr:MULTISPECIES: hypothetical protein [unclassified Campylobacter]MDA3042883.1 hypothetical protein [Campylobacter sp. JMF_09 ED2]MDA3044282.1 hypothetical protein [Campylobacter sp. JMF_07 ED4]MDA3046224.1 hypothetical protein [Campylobacter sp. VBCF_06 NA8]MDA3063631.1 hypothetical protein [Campylobacter sp. JMF_11 EL3]MDA3071257.1 hypothetical protein [Campylobacter sp. VBCF_03 NA9]
MAKFGFLSHSDMSKAKSRKLLCDEPQRTPQSRCGVATATRRGLAKFLVTKFYAIAKFFKNYEIANFANGSYRFANLSLNLKAY